MRTFAYVLGGGATSAAFVKDLCNLPLGVLVFLLQNYL